MILDINLNLARGNFCLDATIQIDRGERVGIIGPNGSGKSTLLAAIAGHLPIDQGHITLQDHLLDSGRSRARTWVPPHRRQVGWLGASDSVFPHLTVQSNVEYGLKATHQSRSDNALRTLEAFDLTDLSDRKASTLSTGQKCRTSLARAFAVNPPLLLLDEPFSGLDVRAASHIRTLVAHMLPQRQTTLLIVSHDLVDLASLATRLIVLDQGTIVDDGPLERVLTQPRSQFVADLAGVTLLQGTWKNGNVHTPLGNFPTDQTSLVSSVVPPAMGDVTMGAEAGCDKVDSPLEGTPTKTDHPWVAIPQEAIHLDPTGQQLLVEEVSMSSSGLVIGVANEDDLRIHLPMTTRNLLIKPGDTISLRVDLSQVRMWS